MIRLLLADVDGTLVTREKVLTERARSAVGRLRVAGIEFAITSGRPPRGMQMLIELLALSTPIAGFNGGMFVRPDLSVVEQRVLPREVIEPAMETMRAHGLDTWIYRGTDWFVHERHGPHVDREELPHQSFPALSQSRARSSSLTLSTMAVASRGYHSVVQARSSQIRMVTSQNQA